MLSCFSFNLVPRKHPAAPMKSLTRSCYNHRRIRCQEYTDSIHSTPQIISLRLYDCSKTTFLPSYPRNNHYSTSPPESLNTNPTMLRVTHFVMMSTPFTLSVSQNILFFEPITLTLVLSYHKLLRVFLAALLVLVTR